jgi:NAD(P)-dependent dehydrogenase (short-subunit alcohol dehydrogenase family)
MNHNPFSLNGKTILVTGASSGIGQAIAIELSKMGATLCITGRNEEKLAHTYSSLETGDHLSIIADLTENLEEFVQQLPKLNGVVHSAGILEVLPFKLNTLDKIQSILDINYISPTLVTRLLLKKKKLQRGSSIIFIASINGVKVGVQGFSNYAGTKGAIVGMAKALSVELAPRHRVNCILPGMIKTPMSVKMQDTISEENVNKDKALYPMGDYGEPNDVANAVTYLLSNASKWITGTSIVIDGGFTAR